MTRSLLSNAGILGTGQLVYAACQWGILITLARLGGPAMVGRFALALAITAPIVLLGNLALRPALVTDVRGEHPLGRYLELRVSTTLLSFVIVSLTVLALGYDRDTALLILIVALAKCFESVSDILYGMEQRSERFDRIAVSLGARAVLGLAGLVTVVWWTGEIVYGALAWALAWGAVLLAHDWPATAAARRASADAGPPRAWLALAWKVLPLGIAVCLISLNTNLPRYVIAERFGETELGVFAAMAYLVVAGGMLVSVLGQVATPRLARAGAQRDVNAFSKVVLGILAVSLALGLAGLALAALLSRPIIEILYGTDFLGGAPLLIWMIGVALLTFVSSCLGFATTALRIFRPAPLVHGITATTNLAACVVLLDHGVHGVIVAWMISLSVNSALHAWLIVRHWRAMLRGARSPVGPIMVSALARSLARRLARRLTGHPPERRAVATSEGPLPEAVWRRLPIAAEFQVAEEGIPFAHDPGGRDDLAPKA